MWKRIASMPLPAERALRKLGQDDGKSKNYTLTVGCIFN